MERKLTIAALGIAALITVKVLLNLFLSPMNAVRADLKRELERVPREAARADAGLDFATLQSRIAEKPGLWQELVAPPPPPPAAPKEIPLPNEPDLAAMLNGIQIGRGQIGTDKIRIHTPDAPRGTWVAIGSELNGCTLVEITPDEAIFSYYWEEGKKALRIGLPRPGA